MLHNDEDATTCYQRKHGAKTNTVPTIIGLSTWSFLRTTVGYGDITSANDLERGFAIVGMIVGATVFGYIIGNVAVIMENFDVVNAIESSKMNQIKDWLYDRKVSAKAFLPLHSCSTEKGRSSNTPD